MTAMDSTVGFRASTQLVNHLQRVLVDLIALHLNAKQAHWNLVGHNFRDLHLQLDEIVGETREAGDTIAERMRALEAVPDGRPRTVASANDQPELPAGEQNTAIVVDLITNQLRHAAAVMRQVHDDVDREDPVTADLLHQMIAGLEKFAWMVSAENHRA